MFVSTERIVPWGAPEDGDVTRAVCPVLCLERGLRKSPVPDPSTIANSNTRFLINCLHSAHVSGAYSALKDPPMTHAHLTVF